MRARSTESHVFEKRIQANRAERISSAMQAERNPIDTDNAEVKYLNGDSRGSSCNLPKNAINPCLTLINSRNGLFHFFDSTLWTRATKTRRWPKPFKPMETRKRKKKSSRLPRICYVA